MHGDTTYSYKGSEDFVIENGIFRGSKEPFINEHTSFGESILERLKANPEFVGQVDGLTGKEESFAEMMEKSVKCAIWMKKQNVKPGDIIGICSYNHMNMYVPCFASLYIGAVFNPWWNAGITRDLTRHFLTLTRPNMLFADEASAGLAIEVAKEIDIPLKVVVFGNLPGLYSLDDILASQGAKNVSQFKCTELSSCEDPALIAYTSGTTGLPKGIVHSHKSLSGNIILPKTLGRTKNTTTPYIISISFSPLAWASGMLTMLNGAVRSEKRIIYPKFTEETTFQLIEKYKINWIFLGASTAVSLLKSPARSNYDLSSIKCIPIGGSPVSDEIYKALVRTFPQAVVRQAYGSTELFGVAVEQVVEQPKSGSCGVVAKNITMKVIDTESGVVLGPNQMGEACFKYPFTMTGYYNNPKATNEAIDAEGWLHSGDLVHYDEEGNVFVNDRIKELIKFRGNHVSPTMIEGILGAHPEVSEVAVIAVPDAIDDEHPIAFVVKKSSNAQVTKEDLQKLVADELPDYMKLRGGVEFLKEMPRTPSGKIARNCLKKMARSAKIQ